MGRGPVTANDEAIEAWNGVLFDRFVQFRDVVVHGLGPHGDEALRWSPPQAGERALDIGCGFGDTTQQIAELVGPEGEALGVDAAPRFIEAAREEAAEAGVDNVRFDVVDVGSTRFDERFDYAYARFGTMFFANPVAAMRNVREALRPGGRLCNVVWRRKLDNPWLHSAEQVVERFALEDNEPDEPTCGPGPFSMADGDTTTDILRHAGFEEVALRRCDLPIRIGRDLDDAVAYAMALGPAGELIRLAGDQAEELRPRIEQALREELARYEDPDGGVTADASTWIVTARAPGGGART